MGSNGITHDGRASSSASKNNNSMAVALREKTLKLAPPSRIVAPSGELRPGFTVGRIVVGIIWTWFERCATSPASYSFSPQCRYPAKPELPGAVIGNWVSGHHCSLPAFGGADLATSGSINSGEDSGMVCGFIAFKRSGIDQVAGDVVEPEALAKVMQ